MRQRRAQLLALLQPEPLPWTEPLRETFCFPLIGELTASFETSWGTWGSADPYQTGGGSFSTTVPGATNVVAVNAVAGYRPEPENAGLAVVMVVVSMADGSELVVWAETDANLIEAGVTLGIDEPPTEGLLFESDSPASGQSDLIGLLADGGLRFDQLNLTSGGLITGTIEGLVYQPTF